MKKLFSYIELIFIILLISYGCEKNDIYGINYSDIVKEHPRILLLKGEEQHIADLIASDQVWKKMHNEILSECNNILIKPPVERVLVGYRLLSKSRECLKRVLYLSYAYRMTGNKVYFNRAEQEMLAVSDFSDWNPKHFLDVAEMTMALAIGYDWLYDQLSDSSRVIISEAIVTKGINPSYDSKYNWFFSAFSNWNQVCNAGMIFGALAVHDEMPELAQKTIDRTLKTIELPMRAYQPNGVYPEGYLYWGYGTTFNVLLLNAFEKALKTDGGLKTIPGFLSTADYLTHIIAPSGNCFNYSDCRPGGKLNPAMFWFADKLNKPTILWSENNFLQKDDFSIFTDDRLLPCIMIWGKNIPLSKITEPAEKVWIGKGENPVAMLRTSWTDPDAIYLGFKAGSPSVDHGHMDIGSFIMESNGVRWASDPGLQDYESMESKGIEPFRPSQDAQRWTVYRHNNHSHNVITVNNELQVVSGYAKIDKSSGADNFKFAVSNTSSVYKDQLKKAVRGVAIKDQKYVVVRDEIETLDKATVIKWAIFTFADVELSNNNSAILSLGNEKLYMKVYGPANLVMKTWSTAPNNNYDAINPGTIMVGFEYEIPPNTLHNLEVLMVPEKTISEAVPLNKSLNDW